MSQIWDNFTNNLVTVQRLTSDHAVNIQDALDKNRLIISGDDQDMLARDVLRFAYFSSVQQMSYFFLQSAFINELITEDDIFEATHKHVEQPYKLANSFRDKNVGFHPFEFKPVAQTILAVMPLACEDINEFYEEKTEFPPGHDVDFPVAHDLVGLTYERAEKELDPREVEIMEHLAAFKTAYTIQHKINVTKNPLAAQTYADALLIPQWYFTNHNFSETKSKLTLANDPAVEKVTQWAEAQFKPLIAMPITYN